MFSFNYYTPTKVVFGKNTEGKAAELIREFGGRKVLACQDYLDGIGGLPKSDVLKYQLEDECSLVVRPSGTEPKLKLYVSVTAEDAQAAKEMEHLIVSDAEHML